MSRNVYLLVTVLSTLTVILIPANSGFGQGWNGPTVIDNGSHDIFERPQIAMAPDGKAVATFSAWSEIIPLVWSIKLTYANVFNGSSWEAAQRIDADNDDWESMDPVVAMDGSGNAFAAFEQLTGDSHVYTNYWNGSAWEGAEPADSSLERESDWPAVAMDGSGDAIAVFRVYDTYNKIFAGYWNGSAWNSLQIISPLGASTSADSPGIAMDSTGNAIAVWRQYGSPNRIYARHWNGASWTSSTTIDMGWGENALSPKVMMDGSGNALVVFFNQNASHNQRACAVWWDGSSWSEATTIDNDSGYSSTGLQGALSTSGQAIAVFKQYDGSNSRVYVTHWDTSSWSIPTTIDSGMWETVYDPVVAIDGAGRAVAAWEEWSELPDPPDASKLYASVYDGSGWGTPVRIDREVDTDDSYNPQVAIDAVGHAIVVFDQEDGSAQHIYANRYVFPSPVSSTGDYDGNGTSDLAVYRQATGLWKIRNVSNIYFGTSVDEPVPQDYDGDGTWDLAYFRPSTGLWKVKNITRIYFGNSTDEIIPADYDGDGTTDPAYFRPSTTLWNVRNQTRIYFGTSSDEPISADYNGDGTVDPTFFRGSSGLWRVRNFTNIYFGTATDTLVPGDYNGDGTVDFAWFRPSSGLWKVKDWTRVYFGASDDVVIPGDFDGDGTTDYGYFRPASILWKVKDITRVYFGLSDDTQVTNPY